MTDTFPIVRAQRSDTPIIIGLAGPSKCGKTYSALRLAIGLAGGGAIAVLNTEGKRGMQYAERFDYQILNLEAPFSPARYTSALEQIAATKPAVIIVDSISHEHEGEGGEIDMHEQEMDRLAGANADYKRREAMTWAAWVKPKRDGARLCALMDRLDCFLILCMRGQEKIKPPKKGSAKDVIDLGWQPICAKRMSYLTDMTLILPPGSKGVPDMSAQGSEMREPFDTMIHEGQQIDEDLGRTFAAWAKGKSTAGPTQYSEGGAYERSLLEADSQEALRVAYNAIPEAGRAAFNKLTGKLKREMDARRPQVDAAKLEASIIAARAEGDVEKLTELLDMARTALPEEQYKRVQVLAA